MTRKLILISALMLAATLSFAHDGHNHEAAVEAAPHGGILRDAPPYKSEVVLNGDNVKLYVYDKALKPMEIKLQELSGDVQFPRQKTKPVTFKKSGEVFVATIPGIGKVHRYDMHVFLDEKKTIKADFGIDNIQ